MPCAPGVLTLVAALLEGRTDNGENPRRTLPQVGNGCIGQAAGVCGNAAGAERFHIWEQYGHGLIAPPT